MRLLIGLILVGVVAPAFVQAQDADRPVLDTYSTLARAPLTVGGPHVDVIRDEFEEPILVVDYPWSTHHDASIEISTLPPSPAEFSEVRPLFFFSKFFHGDHKLAIYRCQDASSEVPTKVTFADAEIRFDVSADRNSLGKPAACTTCSTQVEVIGKVVERAFFCLFDPWALDRRTLQFDLPKARFSKAVKIRLWFLKGDAVVWSEDVDWPGYPE